MVLTYSRYGVKGEAGNVRQRLKCDESIFEAEASFFFIANGIQTIKGERKRGSKGGDGGGSKMQPDWESLDSAVLHSYLLMRNRAMR